MGETACTAAAAAADTAVGVGTGLSPLASARETVANLLCLPDDDLLAADYIIAVVISNAWTPDADPLWGWLIAPPGSYKTEILRTLEGYPSVHYLSSLSQCALVSGYDTGDDDDKSLLPHLHRKVLTIKDFTAILSQPDNTIRQIFGDLRDAYDGSYAKHFGTVGERRYTSKFGILAAVTPAIDQLVYQHVILGERFLSLRLCKHLRARPHARLAMLRHVRRAMSHKTSWRKQLSSSIQGAITAALRAVPSEIIVPDSIDEQLVCIADLVANFRALPAIVKARAADDHHSDLEPELGSRLVNQLTNLAFARCVADGRDTLNDTDMSLVRRVALDTLPPTAALVAIALFGGSSTGHFLGIRTLSKATTIPVKHLKAILTQYLSAGLVEVRSAASAAECDTCTAAADAYWRLSPHTLELFNISHLIPSPETAEAPHA
jgi:hypothetical protein